MLERCLNSHLAALENQNSVPRIHVNSLKLLVIPIIRDLLPLASLDIHVWLSFVCSWLIPHSPLLSLTYIHREERDWDSERQQDRDREKIRHYLKFLTSVSDFSVYNQLLSFFSLCRVSGTTPLTHHLWEKY